MTDDEEEFYRRWYVRTGWQCFRIAILPLAFMLAVVGAAALVIKRVAERSGRRRRAEMERDVEEYT